MYILNKIGLFLIVMASPLFAIKVQANRSAFVPDFKDGE